MATGTRRGPGRPRIGKELKAHADDGTRHELERRAALQGVPVAELIRVAVADLLTKPETYPHHAQEPLTT